MKKKFYLGIRHPIIVITALVITVLFAWSQYAQAARNLNISRSNLLSNGNFETFDKDNLPLGWELQASGSLAKNISSEQGYIAGKNLQISVSGYKNGDVLLLSPKTSLAPRANYLFKGYYLATAGFDLLVKYFYKDGTSELKFVRSYPYFDDPWSTASVALNTGDNVEAAQIAYRVASNGWLKLNGLYLTRADEVYVQPHPASTSNLLSNIELNSSDIDLPSGWSNFSDGNNKADFFYDKSTDKHFLHINMLNFKDGEAKWRFAPIQVVPGQQYQFDFDYRASDTTELVAEYTLKNGSEKYDVIDNLTAASGWTHYSAKIEVPAEATNLYVVPVMHHNGFLDSTKYSLDDITLSGPLKFRRPLISITYDDGWRSAYTLGAKISEEFGFKDTFYVNPGAIDNDAAFMKSSYVADLIKRGHEVASHGYDHVDMTAISRPEINRQLMASRGYLEKKFGLKNQDFATPYGKDDAEVQAVIRENYRSHRGTETGINTRQNFDPYNLKVIFVRTDTPLSNIRAQINEAKANNAWLILTYHRIEGGDNKSEMITSPTVFRQHLEVIKESGIDVVTVQHALDELQEQR